MCCSSGLQRGGMVSDQMQSKRVYRQVIEVCIQRTECKLSETQRTLMRSR